MKRSSTSIVAERVFGNTDILWQILVRLPTKTLLRFKCVSKHWLSLISDKKFRHMHSLYRHRHQHHPPPSIIRSYKGNILLPLTTGMTTLPAHSLDLSFLDQGPIIVVRSCNGLLLCRADLSEDDQFDFFVCNPITKEFVSLPPNPNPNRYPSCVYLAFDPSRSPNFKVVFTLSMLYVGLPGVDLPIANPIVCRCVVYSSETDSWSELTEIPTPDSFHSSAGVYCNGAIHWSGNWPQYHMFLDIETLCMKVVKNTFRDYRTVVGQVLKYFGESGGRLHLALAKTEKSLVFDVFEMKQDFSLWLFRHHVDLNFAPPQFPDLLYCDWHVFDNPFPIRFAQEGMSSMMMLVLFLDRTGVLLYDPLTLESRKIPYDLKPNMSLDRDNFCGTLFQYIESLAPVEAKLRHNT